MSKVKHVDTDVSVMSGLCSLLSSSQCVKKKQKIGSVVNTRMPRRIYTNISKPESGIVGAVDNSPGTGGYM